MSLAEVQSWVDAGLIEWPGHVPVRPWLAQASVFVLPSYREGVPRSTQEAMALGLPIVTTDVPGCRETVAEGKNGFLVPVRNAARLAEAMRYFLDHPEKIVRSEEHTSELQSLMRISYAVFCLKKKTQQINKQHQICKTRQNTNTYTSSMN